jgi:hypothetical protein
MSSHPKSTEASRTIKQYSSYKQNNDNRTPSGHITRAIKSIRATVKVEPICLAEMDLN